MTPGSDFYLFLVDYSVHFSEMVTEDAVGNCQGKDFGFIPDTPQDQLPVVYPVFIDDPDVKDGLKKCD